MGASSMKKLLSAITYAVLFVVGGFVVLWIFDALDVNLVLMKAAFCLS